ncbi:MAG: hypothetical protein KKD44_26185 [Proteobacteria bacterium]|nr:hypothetical protein [Pseudomonadota bacterium]
MEKSFEELAMDLIAKDPELIKTLKRKIAEALEKVDLREVIDIGLKEAVGNVFEELDLSTEVTEPVKSAITKFLNQSFPSTKTKA